MNILEERKLQVYRKGADAFELDCNKQSAAGSVSQRACVFCGSRVVLYPSPTRFTSCTARWAAPLIRGISVVRFLPAGNCIA